MNQLHPLLNALDSVDCINRGGCGISALVIYKWLQQNGLLTSDFKIVFLYDNEYSYEVNSERLNNGQVDKLIVPAHVCVYNAGYYIDSQGMKVNVATYRRVHAFNNVDYLIGVINSPNGESWVGNWNWAFVRKQSVPYIQEITGIDLSEVALE